MKYFIDFEAMQFTKYIISIGCVREDGKEFYSLVHTPEGSKHTVSKFITDLTGITTEMVKEAPTPEQVFSDFYDFCTDDDSIPQFYCYGNCDVDFIKCTFKKTNSFKAKTILGYMYADMRDFAPEVKVHFGLSKLVGLVKVYEYFVGEEVYQTHNSLEDAKMLKEVYFGCKNEKVEEIDETAFLDYKEICTATIGIDDTRFNVLCCNKIDFNKEGTKVFGSLKEAIQYLFDMDKGLAKSNAQPVNLAKRIKSSFNNKKQYNGVYWSFEVK